MVSKSAEADIVLLIKTRPKDRLALLKKIPVYRRPVVLLSLSYKLRERLLRDMTDSDLLQVLHSADPDDVTDLLQIVDEQRRNYLLKALNDSLRNKVEFLLGFDPKTAAGIMSLDYVIAGPDYSFSEVSRQIQKHEQQNGRFPVVLVMSEGKLMGEIPGHAFLLARPSEKIGRHVSFIPILSYNADEHDVLRAFVDEQHTKVAVIDEDSSVLGVIFSHDILRYIQDSGGKGLYSYAGVSHEETSHDNAMTKVRYRYKWLIINIAHAFLAAAVVSMFHDTISAFVLLAVYMPIVAAMGGNAATQTLAIVVRGLALKELDRNTARRMLMQEVIAGVLNGIIVGTLVGLIAFIWNQSILFGLVLFISMILNMVVAGIFGTIIPLFLKKIGKDPAASATIFITTATDVGGFFLFLGLATLLLL
jgi:magnesium transporter